MGSNRKDQLIDFTLVTNPIGPSNQARHAMRRELKASDARPGQQVQSLVVHLCKKLGITPGELCLGHGSSQLLSIFIQATKPKGILIPSPFPALYGELFERQGVEILRAPLK